MGGFGLQPHQLTPHRKAHILALSQPFRARQRHFISDKSQLAFDCFLKLVVNWGMAVITRLAVENG